MLNVDCACDGDPVARQALILLTAALAVVSASGCAPSSQSVPSSPVAPIEQTAGGRTLLVAGSAPTAVMEAQVIGELEVSTQGCLGVAVEGDFVLAVFPYDSALSADGKSVRVPGAGELEVGDAIDGGGGWVPGDTVPLPCGPVKEVVMWQTVS